MKRMMGLAILVLILEVSTMANGCSKGDLSGGQGLAAQPWRGVHVFVGSQKAAETLRAEVPDLAAIGVNVIVAEVDYGFQYASHPELASKSGLSREEARALAAACRQKGIRLIPQFQCLGHQSWDKDTGPLLTKHPEFDETPGQYPRNEGLYCRSWCPLNPEVNPIIFDLMDELLDAFQADALHVGMDEVFVIASEHCPRCKGKSAAELFAKAVNDYHAHLVGRRKVEMLMWGDRLIDDKATGYGKYESSQNGTWSAIDAVPKDIIICDWHYGKQAEYPSVRLFQEKGFRVWPAGWKDVDATEALIDFSEHHKIDARMLGHLCTTWGSAKPGEISQWPPVRAAMTKLGGIKQEQAVGPAVKPRALVGAYYFDGWAGHREGVGEAAWAKNAPTHLTERMLTEFPEREPVWGWRDDSLEIMERQIDLAADGGLGFFAFCWYWNPDEKAIRSNPANGALELFLKAKNNRRMKFCLLVANHQGFLLENDEAWKKAADLWMPYLTHPQALKIAGKPVVIIFNHENGTKAGFDYLQAAARKAGLPGVAVVACAHGPLEKGYGYRTFYNIVPGYAAGSQQHKYEELVAAHKKEWQGTAAQPFIPEVTAGWDKRPWEGLTGLGQAPGWYFPDRTPEQVAAFLGDAIRWMDEHPSETTAERLVLVYAWNELGEGGYIAPTKGDPQGRYLKAMREVIYSTSDQAAKTESAASETKKKENLHVGNLKADRLLCLGNSITLHGPKADIGWKDNWGMAASAAEKDYSHLLVARFTAAAGAPPEAMIENAADFERQYATFDADVGLKKVLDFKADVIVLAIGENVIAPTTDEGKAAFKAAMDRLLKKLQQNGRATIFVRSSFWPNATTDGLMRQACQDAGDTFIDISGLAKDEANYARSERHFEHGGVAAHPGDKGMQAIADAIWTAIAAKSQEK
jgi:hypothetical protein